MLVELVGMCQTEELYIQAFTYLYRSLLSFQGDVGGVCVCDYRHSGASVFLLVKAAMQLLQSRLIYYACATCSCK